MVFQPGQSGNVKGRPRGARNRATVEREAELQRISAELGLDASYPIHKAIHLLRAVANHPRLPLEVKLDAMKTVVKYEEPLLTASHNTHEVTVNIAQQLSAARRRMLAGEITQPTIEAEAVRVLGEAPA